MKLKENLGLFFFLLLLLGALWNSHFHLSRHNFLTLVINEKVADKFFSRSNSNFVSYDAAATADVAECVVQVFHSLSLSLFHFLCSLISQNVSCSVRTADRELPSIHSFIHLLIHLHVFTSFDRPAAAVAAAFVAVAVVFIFSSASPCTP